MDVCQTPFDSFRDNRLPVDAKGNGEWLFQIFYKEGWKFACWYANGDVHNGDARAPRPGLAFQQLYRDIFSCKQAAQASPDMLAPTTTV